jgi:aminoglycoside phosphotransferase (APT) family kinase protein
MTRPTWEELPSAVTDAVRARCGPVLKADSATAGIMPGVAARLHLEDGGTVFIKAIMDGHEASALHLRERWAGCSLPTATPAPRMLWADTVGGWHTMLWQHVDKARHADLSPGSPDLPAILDTMALLGAVLTPCPSGALPVGSNVASLLVKARRLLGGPDRELPDRDLYEAAIERLDLSDLRGDTLLHYDLSAGNLLVTDPDATVTVVDWSFAVRGAGWIEAALFAPRLVEAGHRPGDVDELLSTLPEWKSAPRRALLGITAAWTLFRIYKARYGPQEVREARARTAQAGRTWLTYQQTKK